MPVSFWVTECVLLLPERDIVADLSLTLRLSLRAHRSLGSTFVSAHKRREPAAGRPATPATCTCTELIGTDGVREQV